MCQLRLEIRICKQHTNLDNLKLLIKKRKNFNQQLIYVTKNQWKDLDRQELEEIDNIKTLETDSKEAEQTLLMQRKLKKTRHPFQKIAKYTGKARSKKKLLNCKSEKNG
jgi:hypothetical protein